MKFQFSTAFVSASRAIWAVLWFLLFYFTSLDSFAGVKTTRMGAASSTRPVIVPAESPVVSETRVLIEPTVKKSEPESQVLSKEDKRAKRAEGVRRFVSFFVPLANRSTAAQTSVDPEKPKGNRDPVSPAIIGGSVSAGLGLLFVLAAVFFLLRSGTVGYAVLALGILGILIGFIIIMLGVFKVI
jgi:hypothetical protein